jgi:hypothetical protein
MSYLTPEFLRRTMPGRSAKVTRKGRYLKGGGYKKQYRAKSQKVKVYKKGRFIPKEYSY